MEELLELVGKMIDGHGGPHSHINDAAQEVRDLNPGERVDEALQDRALLWDKALDVIN